MNIDHSTVLVAGANRGLGAAFCRALQERGASKIYAAARRPNQVDTPGVVPVQLDITSAADIDAAVERCGDVTLLINNAGIGTGTGVFADHTLRHQPCREGGTVRRHRIALPGGRPMIAPAMNTLTSPRRRGRIRQ